MTATYAHEVESDTNRIYLRKMNNVKISPIGIVVLVFLGVLTLYYIQRSWLGSSSSEISDVRGVSGHTISLKQLLSASIYAAERGGVEVVKVRSEADMHEKSKGKTKEGANNPVTDGDMKSHEAIVHALKVTFPGLPIVSEESEEKKKKWDPKEVKKLELNHPEINGLSLVDKEVPIGDVTIWVDPLDATQEYTVWAWVNHGHSKQLTAPTYKDSLKTSPKIIVSRSHAGNVEAKAKETFGEGVEVIAAGGAGYKVLELFAGNADAYIHTTLIKKWDICAGNAILKEMNSKMTTLKGEPITYEFTSNPKNDGGLLATIWDHSNFLAKLSQVS
ncbi:Inositol monophosphatase 3 [Holothuria leucospilota]|uniref:inositol-phosphate phosphatase n=1 Tax=Holothuria leucospilota TaxID=206669 RepID=A0A9Q1H3B5_HOLLE|nr:Inositol monophosphatase 3 [Holothuria leucospilota]